MRTNNDLRIKKTNELFFDATKIHLIKKTIIKVLSICKTANRSSITFYHHFSSKIDLINATIKDQLKLVLPIPNKLKPKSFRQLVYYLVDRLTIFFNSNNKLFCSNYEFINSKIKNNSYFKLFFIIIKCLVCNEMSNLNIQLDKQTYEVLSVFILGGLCCVLLVKIIINKQIANSNNIWETIKLFVKLFDVKYN